MTCIICGRENRYYFSKDYSRGPFGQWMEAIGPIAYHRCERCGFVLSKTHADLSKEAWGELNTLFHAHTGDPDAPNHSNQAPYAEQAIVIATLGRHGVIDTSSMLDFAGGMRPSDRQELGASGRSAKFHGAAHNRSGLTKGQAPSASSFCFPANR